MGFVEHGSTLSNILKLLETPLSPIVLTHCAQMLDQMQFELSTARREKCTHTSYLSFFVHGQDFSSQNFTPKSA